jgi:Fic family protein
MPRTTGTYRITSAAGENVRAFVPLPLPPHGPSLRIDETIALLLTAANTALGRLAIAGTMIPSANWFLYGFVRKEAVITSQIEGTQATLEDLLSFEGTQQTQRPDDIEEVCNYVDALAWARQELAKPRGLPLSIRLLCGAHKRLLKGARGANKMPGEVRRSQNWIGGTRPGNAVFVPPPPDVLSESLASLERWLHQKDDIPPLIRTGLAHVQFETIHPFLDGNGRIGRLLIALLLEHYDLLPAPLLYLSLALKRRQRDYYTRLAAVRTKGDWEGWIKFFLECVHEAAEDGIAAAQRLFALLGKDRGVIAAHPRATIPAVRLFDLLPDHPVLTLARAMTLLKTTKPTAIKAIAVLQQADILHENTGRQRNRIYVYQRYLRVLTEDTEWRR